MRSSKRDDGLMLVPSSGQQRYAANQRTERQRLNIIALLGNIGLSVCLYVRLSVLTIIIYHHHHHRLLRQEGSNTVQSNIRKNTTKSKNTRITDI